MPYQFVTTATVATECGMGVSTIRQYAREDRIPVAGTTPGGHYRYDLLAVKTALIQLGARFIAEPGDQR